MAEKNAEEEHADTIKGEECEHADVVIIGGGCAGLTAALYCARADLKTMVFAGGFDDKGGLLVKTSIVENFPGFEDGILGYDLVEKFEKQAKNHGAIVIDKEIIRVSLEKEKEWEERAALFEQEGEEICCQTVKRMKGNWTINEEWCKEETMAAEKSDEEGEGEEEGMWVETAETTKEGKRKKYTAKAIIIATGSKPLRLGLPNEDKLWARGISSCAVCDGALYRNKKIVVVGGGDSAMEEALFLTKFSSVLLIHRRDTFRASQIMQKRVLNNSDITIWYNTVITELKGDKHLESIVCLKDGDETYEVEVDGLFYGLGLKPNTSLFGSSLLNRTSSIGPTVLEMDDDGYILTFPTATATTQTSKKGVFVCGDAHDKIYRQAIVASGDGCRAAMDATKYIEEHYF